MEKENLILTSKQKALRINLDPNLYGTFSEIGAGQEVVRHFFRAGGASGTVAKTMSAYDKDFSDAIYGREAGGRYVCEPRLKKMIKHEYNLINQRLDRTRYKDTKYFAFANTIATINFAKTNQGHGWMGIEFQHHPEAEPSEVTLHLNLFEKDARLQQETVGVLGVNLTYHSLYNFEKPLDLLKGLYDHLDRTQIEIDMIQMSGPAFDNVDNRLLSLYLVKYKMTDAVVFGHDGKNYQASDIFYKKHPLAIRGSFRPVTKVNMDMLISGYNKFIADPKVDKNHVQVVFELTFNNLTSEGDINERDFLDRVDILCNLGQTVIITNYPQYYKLVEFFSKFTNKRMGLILGVNNLTEIFNEKYYRNMNGGMLEAFGIIFMRDVKFFLYPQLEEDAKAFKNSKNLEIHPRVKPLYDYLTFNRRIIDLEDADPNLLHIYSRDVLRKIRAGDSGWENEVPAYVDDMIKENKLFGYQKEKVK
jgi:hypothetical protein